jgi:hypothetical protein
MNKVQVAVNQIVAFANSQRRTVTGIELPLVDYGPMLDADFNEVGRLVAEQGFEVEFIGRQPGFPGTGRIKVTWNNDNTTATAELPETP